MGKYTHYVLTPQGFLYDTYTTDSESIGPDETRAPYPDSSGLYRYSRKNMRWYPVEDDSIYIEEQRNLLRQRVAEIRWKKQTGGFKTPANMYVRTDDTSISDIAFLASCVQDDQKVTYKAVNGFYDLMGDQVRALLALAHAHVQACFDNDKRLSDAIAKCTTLEQLESVNIYEGWPVTLLDMEKFNKDESWEPADVSETLEDGNGIPSGLPEAQLEQQTYKPDGLASERLKSALAHQSTTL